MTVLAVCDLPIKTRNSLNGSWGTWRAVARERKLQRACVALWFASVEARALWQRLDGKLARNLTVTFTRIAPSGGLDDDALPASLKSVRDEVAAQLGVDDGPKGPVQWRYAQERGPKGLYSVRITFEVPG